MGNLRTGQKPLKKSVPSTLLPSGVAIEKVEIENMPPPELLIALIKLNLSVVAKAELNDPVKVYWADKGFYCFRIGEEIGQVPDNYSELLNNRVYSCKIVKIDHERPFVVIKLKI